MASNTNTLHHKKMPTVSILKYFSLVNAGPLREYHAFSSSVPLFVCGVHWKMEGSVRNILV